MLSQTGYVQENMEGHFRLREVGVDCQVESKGLRGMPLEIEPGGARPVGAACQLTRDRVSTTQPSERVA